MNDELFFSEYNENFDHQVANKNGWMNLHINILFLELQEIYYAIYIFRIVDEEWGRRVQEKEPPDYSVVRSILFGSLVYKIILGLNKIFSNNKEHSLLKATNQIEQMYGNNAKVQKAIKEIRQKLDTSEMIQIIHMYRDKFFAHLDQKSVLSYCRIDSTSVMKYIDDNEIKEWLSLISNLYAACFGKELSHESQMPPKEDIIYTFFWR